MPQPQPRTHARKLVQPGPTQLPSMQGESMPSWTQTVHSALTLPLAGQMELHLAAQPASAPPHEQALSASTYAPSANEP